MNEERDQMLAQLFERNDTELSGEEFAAHLRRRIYRDAMIARLRKVVLLIALVGVGGFFSDQLSSVVAGAQASIELSLEKSVLGYSFATIGKVAVAMLALGFVARRRIRHWV
jgi:hypothetical protein